MEMASAALSPLCRWVFNFALEEYNLASNAQEEIKSLKLTVSLIERVLQDAEEKQEGAWLGSLKQVMYDAEDVLDEVAADSTLQTTEVDATTSLIVRIAKVCDKICCSGSINKFLYSRGIAHQIKDIRLKLDRISKDKDILGLRPLAGNNLPEQVRTRRPDSSSLVGESNIIGRDVEKENIVQTLLGSGEETKPTNSKNNVHVLSIVGMGGVGKTTLAKLVFNDQTVRQYFHLKVWVCVSEIFDLKKITKEIMDVASASEKSERLSETLNWDLAQNRLKDKIQDKKFLLVLDDVWEKGSSNWESLFESLKCGGKGSKIIVTTRDKKVSNIVKGVAFPLESLSSKDLWPIFEHYAFDGCDPNKQMQLQTVGRQIVERLKGSPLAAKTIGRLLNANLNVKYWKDIMNSETLISENHPDDILPILKLSYDHLLGHLKQCFAYCSLFPKDWDFPELDLVQLWMAHNFIQTGSGFHAETVGIDSLKDLLYKSLFEKKMYNKIYESLPGKNMNMHDLIHDLAESVSKDDCFRLQNGRSTKISASIRHVSIAINSFDLENLKELCEHGNLRTLLFLNKCSFDLSPHLDHLFTTLKRLRVLGLRKCKIKELPTSIGTLKHIRYIDLSYTLIRKLPESICNLRRLQVLKLKHCRLLGALPSNMSALINLRHLDASCELVSNIQGLAKLTALQKIQISGRKVRELGDMGMLKELRIGGLEQVVSKEEAVQAKLNIKEHLEVLELSWDGGRNDDLVNHTLEEEVLDGLRPVDSITRLSVTGYGGVKSPSWMEDHSWASSSFLERVKLKNCRNWEALPALGQMRCLKFLKIVGMKRVRRIGPRFFGCCEDGGGGVRVLGFPSLEELHFDDLPEWEEWELPHEGEGDDEGQPLFLPQLRVLNIVDCPKLRELPPLPPTLTDLQIDGVGLTHLPGWLVCRRGGGDTNEMSSSSSSPSLSSLYIKNCPNLTSLRDGLLQQHPLRTLENLEISGCKELASLPERPFRHLTSLKSLTMKDCPKLSWPPSVTEDDVLLPSSLEEVEIRGCGDKMEGLLLASFQRLTSLSQLVMGGGYQLDAVARLRELTSLTYLKIYNCPNLSPETKGLPSSLETLYIEGGHLDDRALSTCLQGLTSLKSLSIDGCPGITILPTAEVLCHLTALKSLWIYNCEELTSLGGSHALVSLKHLRISNCPKLLHLVEAATSSSTVMLMRLKELEICKISPQQITMWLRQCTSLQTLTFERCPLLTCFDDDGGADIGRELEVALLNLAPTLSALYIFYSENLRSLPSKLRYLYSLEFLHIGWCPQIQCLPVGGLPESLETLNIYECPALEERCREEGGPDWPLISNIPRVNIL